MNKLALALTIIFGGIGVLIPLVFGLTTGTLMPTVMYWIGVGATWIQQNPLVVTVVSLATTFSASVLGLATKAFAAKDEATSAANKLVGNLQSENAELKNQVSELQEQVKNPDVPQLQSDYNSLLDQFNTQKRELTDVGQRLREAESLNRSLRPPEDPEELAKKLRAAGYIVRLPTA